MSDTTGTTTFPNPPVATTSPALTQAQIQGATQPLIDDAVAAEKEITALLAAYKAKGIAGVSSLLPALIPEVEQAYTDVKASLPTIKAGYLTTEFWLVVGGSIFTGVFTALGKVPPVDGATVIGAIIAVYTAVRGIIKK